MKEIIEKLANFEDLSSVEMTDVIERIVTGRVTEAQIASLLLALKMKGENSPRPSYERTCSTHSNKYSRCYG